MRRKSKPIPKSSQNDERKVQDISKKAGLQDIGQIEQANIIMEDGKVTQFTSPRLRALMQANAFVIHGNAAQTSVDKLSPDMQGHMAPGAGQGLQVTPEMAKLAQLMQEHNLSPEDLQDPTKQSKIEEMFKSAGINENELMGQGAAANEDEDVPSLSESTNFEDISDAD